MFADLCRSRIFPKWVPKTQASRGVWGHATPWEIFCNLPPVPKFPFLGSDRILTRFQLGKFFIIKNIFIMKNLTDFCKMVETGVDPHLICLFERHVKVLMCLTFSWFEILLRKWASNQQNVSQNQWTVKMFCSYCTLLEAQGNQRVWYTHRLGTFFIPS